jgi:hypothetical protein
MKSTIYHTTNVVDMASVRISFFLLCVAAMIPLSGCTESLGGCGVGYDEMYGGYDYDFSTIQIASDNSLNVTVHLLNGGGGWFEDSEEFQEVQTIWVSLDIKISDGSIKEINPQSQGWIINGNAGNGSYWGGNLYFTSPVGFCDVGCEEIQFTAGDEFGFIYYDGTCDTSPWVEIT